MHAGVKALERLCEFDVLFRNLLPTLGTSRVATGGRKPSAPIRFATVVNRTFH